MSRSTVFRKRRENAEGVSIREEIGKVGSELRCRKKVSIAVMPRKSIKVRRFFGEYGWYREEILRPVAYAAGFFICK